MRLELHALIIRSSMASAIILSFIFGPTTVSALGQGGSFVGMANCSSRPGVVRMTVEECERDCGHGYHSYEKWEVIGAITTWVIPLFVLVGNVQFFYSKLD